MRILVALLVADTKAGIITSAALCMSICVYVYYKLVLA